MNNRSQLRTRRRFLRELGIGAASIPFLGGLSSLTGQENSAQRKKRLIIMFSPNGTVPDDFWPDKTGADFDLKSVLEPLAPFKDKMLLLRGVSNHIGGDGDNHMRGMSCLLTAALLNPGNIQGGSHTPAGWASGISIDQEIRNFLQSKEETKTRFGSLEFGVAVPNRADPWTRMVYQGDNKPLAPVDSPAQMFDRLYGNVSDRESLGSVLDDVRGDLKKLSTRLSQEDRSLLEEHMEMVRAMESDIAAAEKGGDLAHPEPDIDPEIELVNDNTPAISRMQIDLLVNSMQNDMTRVATLQFMRSVGQARMNWLNIQEGHHSLSHEPDGNKDAYEKLKRINRWFAGELAYLTKKLADTPEPGGKGGSMLDNTQIVWLNELGKGNSHTLENIPFVLIGGGCDFKTGRSLNLGNAAHNRLWMSIAKGMGHGVKTFGKADLCGDGALDLVS